MSAVWVRTDEAERGGLPARCARSGDPCITRYGRRASDVPAAVEWATWSGPWPHGRDSSGPRVVLPLLPVWHRLHEVLRRTRDLTAVVLGTGLVTLLLVDGGLPATTARLAAVAALALHLLVAVAGWALTVEVRRDTTGAWVRLSGVHPDFVRATERRTTRPATPPLLHQPMAPRPASTAGEDPGPPGRGAGDQAAADG